jgi:Fe-S cluster biogenesis protein NfuA
MDVGFRMHAERTPNPNSVKWVLSQALLSAGRSAQFAEPVGADVSPLAARLFAVQGVVGVFVGATFVTVTKGEDVEWTELAQAIVDAIKQFAESGDEAVVGVSFVERVASADGDIAARIRDILENEIRPAVAMDGGDVIFAGYYDGRVELQLQGSCSGCPSAGATLKHGIEARLKEAIPEVTEVVAV